MVHTWQSLLEMSISQQVDKELCFLDVASADEKDGPAYRTRPMSLSCISSPLCVQHPDSLHRDAAPSRQPLLTALLFHRWTTCLTAPVTHMLHSIQESVTKHSPASKAPKQPTLKWPLLPSQISGSKLMKLSYAL